MESVDFGNALELAVKSHLLDWKLEVLESLKNGVGRILDLDGKQLAPDALNAKGKLHSDFKVSDFRIWDDVAARQSVKILIELFFLLEKGTNVNVNFNDKKQLVDVRCSFRKQCSSHPGCDFACTFGKTGAVVKPHSLLDTTVTLHNHDREDPQLALYGTKVFNMFVEMDSELKFEMESYAQTWAVTTGEMQTGIEYLEELFRIRGIPVAYTSQLRLYLEKYRCPSTQHHDAVELVNQLAKDFPGLHDYKLGEIIDGRKVLEWAVFVYPYGSEETTLYTSELTIDGTFCVEDKGYKLLGLTTRDENNLLLPVAFALHMGSSAETYTQILAAVKRIVPYLRPVTCKADGELAIHASSKSVYGGLLRQCFWHQMMNNIKHFRLASSSLFEDKNAIGIKINEALKGIFKEIEKLPPDFHDRFEILMKVPGDLAAFEKAQHAFSEMCDEKEKRFYCRYVEWKHFAHFRHFLFGSNNYTSNDQESIWSVMKAKLDEDKRKSGQVISIVNLPKKICSILEDSRKDRMMKLRKSCKKARRSYPSDRSLICQRFPLTTMKFLDQLVPYAQLTILRRMRAASFHAQRLEEHLWSPSLQEAINLLPNATNLIRANKKVDVNALPQCAPLIFAKSWLDQANGLPRPTEVIRVSNFSATVPYFCMTFEAGCFYCTCGEPIQSGLPCSHQLYLVQEGLSVISLARHIAPKFWKPEVGSMLHVTELPLWKHDRASWVDDTADNDDHLDWEYVIHMLHRLNCLSLVLDKQEQWLQPSVLVPFLGYHGIVDSGVVSQYFDQQEEELAEKLSGLPSNVLKRNMLRLFNEIVADPDKASEVMGNVEIHFYEKKQRGNRKRRRAIIEHIHKEPK